VTGPEPMAPAAAPDPWIVEIAATGSADARPATDEVFYAVPHAGGGAAAVRDLCRAVGRHAGAAAVRLPAREARLDEEPVRDLRLLAHAAAEAIARHAAGRPITLYGHCSGAVIAFEIARRLPPGMVRTLFVSAHEPPDRFPRDGVWRWPDTLFLPRVAADGYLPEQIAADPELLGLLLPALRADYEAVETYRCDPGAALDVPIVGILGDADTAVAEWDFEAWAGFSTDGFTARRLPGGHNLLLDQADAVAGVVAECSAWQSPESP
jgi:medium-chain acyl-[acyl-carrier-protein] hydrolase